jgi:hypothetical protein
MDSLRFILALRLGTAARRRGPRTDVTLAELVSVVCGDAVIWARSPWRGPSPTDWAERQVFVSVLRVPSVERGTSSVSPALTVLGNAELTAA